jgi:hypothetical protein
MIFHFMSRRGKWLIRLTNRFFTLRNMFSPLARSAGIG